MLRIVSLIASATEIVHALGLGPYQVGRSHECDYPPSVLDLPVCTAPRFNVNTDSREIDRRVKDSIKDAASVYRIFEEVLERLEPTHILTQSQCRVCAVSLEDVERALSKKLRTRPQVVALEPNSLADIWNDIDRVARACGVGERGASLIASLQQQMQDLSANVAGRPAPSIAVIEWPEPLMAAGNWTPELVAMANARNLFGEAGRHSPWLQWSDLIKADPDVLLIAPCGYDIKHTSREMYWLDQRPEWQSLKAVQNQIVYLADGNQYFNRPGPRVTEALRILVEILHPNAIEPQMQGVGWEFWRAS